MNLQDPAPLVFFRVLADRGGKPSGLLLDVRAAGAQAIEALQAADSFRQLSARFPCLFPANACPALSEPLLAAGWKPLAPEALWRADGQLVKELIPAAAAWIDGEWCMAPPSRPPGAQVASRTLSLQLVQLVAADADSFEIEALLRQDPTLSYNLLRLVNSLGMGVGRRITSFSQALLILGRQQLRRWLNLMLFAARQGDVRSAMLLARVAVRARALELLAKSRGLDRNMQEQAFMTGMFSLLGVLFGMALPELMAPLALGDAVQSALLQREGELGQLLNLVESAERGDLDGNCVQLAALNLAPREFNEAMADATSWMLGALRETQGALHG